MDRLLNLLTLKKYDSQQMYKIYDKWPEIARNSFESNLESVNFGNVKHVVFAGMGGSGTVGDVFASILSKSNIHVCVVKGYQLPKTADSKTLVITTSISGNTAETLAVLKSAKKQNCDIVAFCSGGKMEKYCIKNNIKCIKIPLIHSPRASFVGFLFSILKVLSSILPLKENEIQMAISQLKKTRNKISSYNLNEKNPSLNLSEWITDIPIIYFPWGLNAAATRFKNSLQENSKIHVITEDVIESSHNGIVSWESSSKIKPILLQGIDDHPKTKERWKILEEYFKIKKIKYRKIISGKGGILSKLIDLIYILDYTTIYLAVLYKKDPSPVKSIEFIKNRI